MKEFLSRKGVAYRERDITREPDAIDELRRLGALATPVVVVNGEAVVGLDEARLNSLLAGAASA